ncbi:hypothetical protein [Deinococcus maricopensis]|uniref:Uncharacterized protein n=1 Tax=Deinococcus maricopensis (strain DSM 21211 / LMG 22137 / NRRL B-23946 / LB-34) TaxID=709986 RepID=E8UC76_DEIML|nr:hypothetical protein [Deinococcus maricopensis]ADV68737.1 hypothetical protein Deima_3108 [Deinococcus maricopensis DSM 21211]
MRFLRLVGRDVWGRLPGLLATVLLLLLGAFAVARYAPDALTGGVAVAALGAVPLLHWVLGGTAALWPEFAQGTFLLWRALGVPGGVVIAARYVRVLLEAAVMAGALLWAAWSFGALAAPLAEVRVAPGDAARLAGIVGAFLLVPPAVALAAGAMGRASRLRGVAGVVVFAALWAGVALWTAIAAGVGPALSVSFANLPSELCAHPGGCELRVSALAVAAQPVLTLLALWVAARALEAVEP